MNTIRIEEWNGHKIRFVQNDDGDIEVVVSDVADAMGYKPVNDMLENDEWITQTRSVSDDGCYFALTNKKRVLFVSHFYGDADYILIPNVARDVRFILKSNDHFSKAFKKAIIELLDVHYMHTLFSPICIPDDLRKELELIVGYKRHEQKKMEQKEVKYEVKRDGFVYFLTADNGLTKIGRTKNLDSRIHHFTTKLPYELEETLILKTDDAPLLESEIHGLFADKRIRGEWFDLNDKDIDFIKRKYATLVIKKGDTRYAD